GSGYCHSWPSPSLIASGGAVKDRPWACPRRNNEMTNSDRRRTMMKSRIIAVTSGLLICSLADAADIKVLSTQATEESYRELVPQFEKATGHKVSTVFTGTLDANKRLAAGETYDLLIMSGPSIDEHIIGGKVVSGSRIDLAKSGIG